MEFADRNGVYTCTKRLKLKPFNVKVSSTVYDDLNPINFYFFLDGDLTKQVNSWADFFTKSMEYPDLEFSDKIVFFGTYGITSTR